MERSVPPMLAPVAEADPALYAVLTDLHNVALSEGALDARTKVLIALALDALAGASQGVKALTGRARGMGVTDAQIVEALRIVHLVATNGVLAASLPAYTKA